MGKNTSEGLQIRMRNPNNFFPQPTNIYILCIQNNGLNEIVLLSNVLMRPFFWVPNQNTC